MHLPQVTSLVACLAGGETAGGETAGYGQGAGMVSLKSRKQNGTLLVRLFWNYELWTDAERADLPAYLKRRCPLGSLREGRRLKTKLRLGCHPLRSSAARMSLTRNAACPCCGHGSETIVHTIFECHGPKLDDVRGDDFPQKLETILPETRNMTNADCLALLMEDESDDPP